MNLIPPTLKRRLSKAPFPLRLVGAVDVRAAVLIGSFLFLSSTAAHAQQPFFTDDADVTDRKKFSLQIGNELDILQRHEYPTLRQNTTVFELNYGLTHDVEIGIDGPLIALSNSKIITPRTPFGIGDLDFHLKYNFLKEREGSWRPALAGSFSVELPTGDEERGLGSGFQDVSINGVLQKTLHKRTTLRLNGGILFAGSTATGDVGIKTRGRAFVGGVSVVREINSKWDLGAEVNGAVTSSLKLSHGQVQSLVGGNYHLTPKMSFDFGVLAGKFNSPRVGAILGISVDF